MTPWAPQRTIAATQLESRTLPVALMAALLADLRPRPADRALPNFDPQPKLPSEFRSLAAKEMELATRQARPPAQRKLRALRSRRPVRASSSPDPRALIPLPARLATARCLCSYRPTSTLSAPSHLHPARLSIFWRAFRLAFSRSCRHAEPGQLSQQRLRRKERTTVPHRPKSRPARVITSLRYKANGEGFTYDRR